MHYQNLAEKDRGIIAGLQPVLLDKECVVVSLVACIEVMLRLATIVAYHLSACSFEDVL
jgi:hypothetical protein